MGRLILTVRTLERAHCRGRGHRCHARHDGGGGGDCAEFVAVMSRKVHASYTPEQVKNSFKVGTRERGEGVLVHRGTSSVVLRFLRARHRTDTSRLATCSTPSRRTAQSG
jgi:hypothetical protein